MTVQIAAKLPDELVATIDGLVEDGVFASRSQAVRRGLEAVVAARRRDAIDTAFRRGYEEHPDTSEELAELSRRSVASIDEEPWDPWW